MKKVLFVLLLLGVLLFFLYRSTTTAVLPFQSDLMSFVPENSSGITACNSGMKRLENYWNSKAMKELKSLITDSTRINNLISPFLTDSEKSEIAPVVDKFVKVTKTVLESKLIKLGFQAEGYVQYQASDSKFPIPVTMALVNLTEAMDFKSDFDDLRNAGLPVDEEAGDGFTYFVIDYSQVLQSISATMPKAPNLFANMKFYIASKGKKLGMGNDKEAITRFFKDEKLHTKPKLLDQPAFIEAEKNIGFDSSVDFCQSYMDFKEMMMTSVNAGLAAAGTNVHSPETEKFFDNFPVLGVMQTAGYYKSISMTQQWSIKESVIPGEYIPWINALTSSNYEGLENMPETAGVATGINGSVLAKLKEVAEKTPETASMLSQVPYVEIASSLRNFSFAITQPSPGIIWPEGILSLKLDKAKELHELAKNQIMQQLSASGMGGFKWLEKDVAGAATSYFNTPFGVGLYLALKDHTFISTGSEAGLSSYLNSDGKTIKTKLAALGMQRLENGLAETFFSIPELLKLSRGMQTSLSMFMPTSFQIAKDFDVVADAVGEYYIGLALTPKYFTFKVFQKPRD